MPDVIQIVDTYPHETEGHRRTLKNDPDREAEGLSKLAMLLGRKPRKIAIVSRDEDAEYVECLECREVFESSEFKDMAIEERVKPETDA